MKSAPRTLLYAFTCTATLVAGSATAHAQSYLIELSRTISENLAHCTEKDESIAGYGTGLFYGEGLKGQAKKARINNFNVAWNKNAHRSDVDTIRSSYDAPESLFTLRQVRKMSLEKAKKISPVLKDFDNHVAYAKEACLGQEDGRACYTQKVAAKTPGTKVDYADSGMQIFTVRVPETDAVSRFYHLTYIKDALPAVSQHAQAILKKFNPTGDEIAKATMGSSLAGMQSAATRYSSCIHSTAGKFFPNLLAPEIH